MMANTRFRGSNPNDYKDIIKWMKEKIFLLMMR
jgi:hypothetical protein